MELDNQEVVDQDLSTTPDSTPAAADPSERSLDEILDTEREETNEIEEANKEGDDDSDSASEEAGDEDAEAGDVEGEDTEPEEGAEGSAKYVPAMKYKVHGQEFPIDAKFKKVMSKETEPLIRELHEKAHGIEAVKVSRDKAVQERQSLEASFNDLTGRVGRILSFKKAGDLESFFESVQLTDDQIARYILQKAEIANLPQEQQAVYNERRALRRQVLESQAQNQDATQTAVQARVQARIQELDTTLGDPETKRVVEAFDGRNGAGSFRNAVMQHAAAQWHASKKDLSAKEAVESFVKTYGVQAPKAQPKPGAQATKRVVARPKVKTIPNLGSSQASVTHTKKPKSIDDLKAIRKEKYGA